MAEPTQGTLQVPAEEAPANAPDSHLVPMIERPEYVPEKFYKDGHVDVKALAQSYGELEKKQSTATPAATKQDVKPGEAKPEVKPGETPPAPPVPEATIPGVTQENLTKYTKEITEGGKLTDGSYEELAKAGYSKAFVDAYVRGLQTDSLVEGARIADGQINEIKASIGGDEVLAPMLEWAKTNLTEPELKEYNEAVSSGNVAKVKLAVTGLHGLYQKEVGSSPDLLGGTPPGGSAIGDVFESTAQVRAAINDPRYKTDEAYRQSVASKIGRSSVL